jgi:SAM-dependent methyltransferase
MRRRLAFELAYLIGQRPWDRGVVPPEVERFAAASRPGRALDLGCGSGAAAVRLAQLGWDVTGVDFSALALRRARLRARQASVPVRWLRRSVLDLDDVQGPFDLALDVGCLHTLARGERIRYWRNLERLLPPDAMFLLYAFVLSDSPGGSRWPRQADLLEESGRTFALAGLEPGTFGERPSAWFTFRRLAGQAEASR